MSDEKYGLIELFLEDGRTIFTLLDTGRIREEDVPDGMHRYSICEGEDVWYGYIAKNVLVNHIADILTLEELPTPKRGLNFCELDDVVLEPHDPEDIQYFDYSVWSEHLTVDEFRNWVKR